MRATLDEAAATTFVESSYDVWCDCKLLFKDTAFFLYWCNLTICGCRAVGHMESALKAMIAPAVAANPMRTAAIVAAPNVGSWGNMFADDEIIKNEDAVEALFKVADHRLTYRRIEFYFDLGTIPKQSKRPQSHRGWMLVSDKCVDASTRVRELCSEFAKSDLWIRRVVDALPMLKGERQVDPMADEIQVAWRSDLSFLANKAARRRQWLAGWEIMKAVSDKVWSGLGLDLSIPACWVDVFGFDHSLPEALMHVNLSHRPIEMAVAVVWADLISNRTPDAPDHQVLNTRIEKWLKTMIRRKIWNAAQESRVVVNGWKPTPVQPDSSESAPTYAPDAFQLTYPSAHDRLPSMMLYGPALIWYRQTKEA